MRDFRAEVVIKFSGINEEKTETFIKEFETSFGNLMKDLGEQYKKEIQNSNELLWIPFIDKSLRLAYQKYINSFEYAFNKFSQEIQYNKEVNQKVQDNLDQFFGLQLDSVKRLRVNLEEFIQQNEDFFNDQGKELEEKERMKNKISDIKKN